MEGPHDLELAADVAFFAAALSAGQGWLATIAGFNAAVIMAEAHLNPSVLYGLLVKEDALGNRIEDLLGYDAYC